MENDQTLAELLAEERKVPPRSAATFMVKLLDELHAVHQQGGVHGRLRPASLHGKGGELEVTGFHRQVGPGREGEKSTEADDLPAAPLQARLADLTGLEPPEHILHPEHADHRTDIYSAGAIFYLMLTGEPPQVEEEKEDLAEAIMGKPAFVPSSVDSEVPTGFDKIVLKALEKNPADRFPSAAVMKSAIELALRGERTYIHLKGPVRYREWPWTLRLVLFLLILQIAYLVVFDPDRLRLWGAQLRSALGV